MLKLPIKSKWKTHTFYCIDVFRFIYFIVILCVIRILALLRHNFHLQLITDWFLLSFRCYSNCISIWICTKQCSSFVPQLLLVSFQPRAVMFTEWRNLFSFLFRLSTNNYVQLSSVVWKKIYGKALTGNWKINNP